ncbi:MAG TPA: putative baseplate assembly protein [Terriglobales bacterium]|nr:putative baseplate assembly protein [Terriglobales bacterium]
MNGSCEIPDQQFCGCCAGIETETPEPIFNRPGLSAIAYRVGTQVTFKASLLAALSSSDQPALAGLRTRDDSDFSIALLDAWATCLDILTFYQERIANESYLRTAVDAASVMGLAQLVGYKMSPGVAASAFLAFTLNSAPGSPDNVLIPAGTRVQSVPAPGQTPQVFETSADLTAVIEENAIPPQTTVQWELYSGLTSLWFQGTANNIKVGDVLLFVSQGLYGGTTTSAAYSFEYHSVTAVATDSTSGNTLVTWDSGLTWPTANGSTGHVYVFRKKVALFGVQAPDPMLLPTSHNNITHVVGWPSSVPGDWDFTNSYTANSSQIKLDASYPGLSPQDNSPAWTLLLSPGSGYYVLFQVNSAVDSGFTAYTLAMKMTQLTLGTGQFLPGGSLSDANIRSIVADTRKVTVYVQTEELTPADFPYADPYATWDGGYTTQPGMLVPVEGSELSIVTGEQFGNGQPVAISGQRVRLQVTGNVQSDAEAAFFPDGSSSSLLLAANQIFLVDAFPPTPATSGSDMVWSVVTTDGVAGTLQINDANVLLIPADQKNDPVVGETVTLNQIPSVAGPIVTLNLTPALQRIYDRSTVAVNANVVATTNGETMYEIMGSGDATNDALQFTLKQSPLTYVASSTGMGASSTLQVWVNNMQWHEVDNFLNSGPTDRVFVTQMNASEQVTVQFGDGRDGERTPTGQMNIRAVYRKGIGSAGNVVAGQLSQALDRPQGLKSVTNPSPALGGGDPDSAATARVSAPLHVLTLDRVVSLEDYQNYALAFAGIAQALATWTWVGRARSIFLTVAGANGLVLEQDQPPITNLIKALRGAGNPYVPITVVSYVPVFFEAGANVSIDTDDYDATLVLAQVWQTLATAFSFAQRQIGQGVAQSEVIDLIQSVPGVIGCEFRLFDLQGSAATTLPDVLQAASPVAGTQGTPTQGAQMLLLDPASQGNFKEWSP